jgi:hypothetical protein
MLRPMPAAALTSALGQPAPLAPLVALAGLAASPVQSA